MLKLPAFFSDGMVINKEAKLWGWASPGERITANFLGNLYETNAENNGRFEITVIAPDYGGPHTLTIGEKIINDVYVGRVWICGGSSNMEEPASRSNLVLGEKIPEDNRIRMFQAERGLDFNSPADDTKGEWNTASGWFLEYMPAVPYFFARSLLEKKSIPIGLICIPVGGTTIEGWLPSEELQSFPDLYAELEKTWQPGYIDKAQEDSDRRIKIWQSSLVAKDRGLARNWHSLEYDDSKWESRMLFDTTHLPRNGSVWIRKRFNLSKEHLNEPVTLRFGRVENSVTVYINGIKVTEVSYMFPPCACVLPEGLLRDGENIITVRIVGDSHNPKIVAGKEYALVFPSGKINLNGIWKWRTGAVMPMCPPNVYLYNYPCGVYNYMLAPILGYSIDGIIWGQGEANTAHPYDYKALFTVFSQNMRKHFGNVPIIYTQIANYVDPYSYNFIEGFGTPGEYWAAIREQQRRCLEIPNTAMAVTIDCGEYNDLHPIDKKTVGARLALHARRLAYGEDIITDGPIVTKAEYHQGRLTIFFKHGEGLWEKGGHTLLDVIDGEGGIHRLYAAIWDNALNVIVGDMNPTAVRFGWADCPVVSLYNAYCLPASPFEVSITYL
ncbi:MAG: beta galactosidase jelly roll domain-containing protein [Defluviitaleaceae bacterium]|nr:beta galactosidase jelly roll domain-containing protein [Defluviitaleaceae bacterium]